jgi:hypothetical protein
LAIIKFIPILIHDMEHCRKANRKITHQDWRREKKEDRKITQPKQKPGFASPQKRHHLFFSSIFLNFPKAAGEAAARHSPSMNHSPSEEM